MIWVGENEKDIKDKRKQIYETAASITPPPNVATAL
jgi:hypothetical protein